MFNFFWSLPRYFNFCFLLLASQLLSHILNIQLFFFLMDWKPYNSGPPGKSQSVAYFKEISHMNN